MTALLTRLMGRLPIGWLQLAHSRTRFLAALAGVAFANILVFVQLGILGALNDSTVAPYDLFGGDIMISSVDANTLTDGSNVARTRMFQALGTPGVADAAPLFIGNIEWQREDGGSSTLQVVGLDPDRPAFVPASLRAPVAGLRISDTVLLDESTRGLPAGALDGASSASPYRFELAGRAVEAVGTVSVGGGFTADGTLYASDQTFLRLFGSRSSAAPNHVLVTVEDGIDPGVVVDRLRAVLPGDVVKVATKTDMAAADLTYQTTERPTGVIFGFGVAIGIVVGLVIVYQVLSTDVADHLREYATFKAMGYGQRFFLGIVLEEAVILAVLGFVPGVAISAAIYSAMAAATGLPLAMGVDRAAMVLAGTIAACVVSGAIATRRLAAADPADLF
ncbi:ABC transporter permease DevC [Jannaschia aquimarina]|uniref:FtsX-like permease family protein n=1 Tax=Jannaschia aquimarina TaxID=935700 RepID=A0A0D1CRE2_9RHOB|nr:ABC transporter permease DevC [Jannaschia aquimarina]KIT17327.1 FtsX-like permease family protein [Jannaschia aquimarina]SNT20373.1 putative ABC transport system permease protein [Jannaschia aquimarina]